MNLPAMLLRTASALAVICLVLSPAAAEQKRIPATRYWINIATQTGTLPDRARDEATGTKEEAVGTAAGALPKKTLLLQLNSPQALPSIPDATHDIPAGLAMGGTLPLLIPERTKPARGGDDPERKPDKPKVRILFYWGCAEKVRPGQPRVLDTEKMGLQEFAKAMSGRTGSGQTPPSQRNDWVYAEWPNRKDGRDVPQGSTLAGEHFVHGNYTPDMKFAIDGAHDFMAPVEFASVTGATADGIRFQWKKIPTAIGYFAMAVGRNDRAGEAIIWTSSNAYDPGYGLMNYLPPADVSRFIREKVVMGPDATSCTVPAGIFKDTNGAMLRLIGYGDELNIAYPPKPKDSTKKHEYVWALKLRTKSTGMRPIAKEEGK